MRAPRPIRNVDAGDLIEMMLVVAVVTIVIIRVSLELSGYPQLGGSGLHIAHVLYGGLMMIGALIIVFALLNISARWAAAFIGGVGFGFFIDEVGKFISNDVNYFFEPAVRRDVRRLHHALLRALGHPPGHAAPPRPARERAQPAARGARRVPRRRDQARDPRACSTAPTRPTRSSRCCAIACAPRPSLERRNFTPYALWRTRLAELVPAQGRPALVLEDGPRGDDRLRARPRWRRSSARSPTGAASTARTRTSPPGSRPAPPASTGS